jgi:hypothetical protein
MIGRSISHLGFEIQRYNLEFWDRLRKNLFLLIPHETGFDRKKIRKIKNTGA